MLEQLDILIGFVTIISVASLVVTVLTGMLSTLLTLRGGHLRAGLTEVVTAATSVSTPIAEQVVTDVLIDPLLTDRRTNWWNPLSWPRRGQLASAVRYEEFLSGLERRATRSASTTKAAITVLKAFGDLPGVTPELRAQLKAYGKLPEEIVDKAVMDIKTALEAAKAHWEKTFNSTMERVQERFAATTRQSNLILGLLVAFFFQLDTFDVFRRISRDEKLRQSLVGAGGAIVKQGEDILTRATQTTAERQPVIFKALSEDLAAHPEPADAAQKAALDQLKALAAKAELVTELSTPVTGRASNGDWDNAVRDSIARHLEVAQVPTGERTQRTDEFLAAYDTARSRVNLARLQTLRADLERSSGLLSGTGFQLIPDKYPDSVHAFLGWKPRVIWFVPAPQPRFWGMVVSAFLLSLGAPYWFNVLKSLSSLRPTLAQKVDESPEKPVASQASATS